ncbi:MAG: hydroxymethylglutaryl-CoA lyase [Planctomycetota bacterium]|nr:MAG: hydroxymethylglutaryl-CoA lyase [Planctomycetota bacterium]
MNGERVRIVEVGPRDGLQNESVHVATEQKIEWIRSLAAAGLRDIEITSFVHPNVVPQLADAAEVARSLPPLPGVTFSALVPNEKGLDRALEAGVRRIAVFTAASETFAQRNIRMSIPESLNVIARVIERAKVEGLTARAYLSTCFVCPFEGDIDETHVHDLTVELLDLGADEVAISDTIGAAVPTDVRRVTERLLGSVPAERIALHLHDTYGTALANVCAGLELGVRTFDASTGGLGGCPFAPGAAGNLATEDLVYLLDRMGYETGVDLSRVLQSADMMVDVLGRPLTSRQWQRVKRSGCNRL